MKHFTSCPVASGCHLADCLCPNPRELGLYTRAFVLSVIAGTVELWAVSVAGSIALFSDVVHIGSDALSYLVAIAVIGIAFVFPAKTQKATMCGVVLIFMLLVIGDILIFHEAWNRMFVPHEVLGLPTLLAAVAGLILNAIVLFISRRTPKHEQNIRHASIDAHALSDVAVSCSVIVAALFIWVADWRAADWIVAFGVAIYLLCGPIRNLGHRIVRGNIRAGEIAHGHEHEHKNVPEQAEHFSKKMLENLLENYTYGYGYFIPEKKRRDDDNAAFSAKEQAQRKRLGAKARKRHKRKRRRKR